VNPDQGLYGPLAGTPMPPTAAPPVDRQPSALPPPTSPGLQTAAPGGDSGATSPAPIGAVAPSAYNGGSSAGPSVAVVHYDPHTGAYLTPDKRLYVQTDLTKSGLPKTLQDLMAVPE
jgi:hypothetical protein